MAEIVVYTTDFCAFCQRAKQLLASRGLQYTEINLARDHEGRAELLERTGLRTFPQIIVGDEVIGGYTETAAAAASGRLDELVARGGG